VKKARVCFNYLKPDCQSCHNTLLHTNNYKSNAKIKEVEENEDESATQEQGSLMSTHTRASGS